MAQELWTSSQTGYTRIGTRLSDIRAIFEFGITANLIFEPIKYCSVNGSAINIRMILDKLDLVH